MNEEEKNYATLFFTHLQIENEIKELWKEIKAVRNDDSIPPPIKISILSRLFEVHNSLDIESIRQQEEYMEVFLNNLKLSEIGVRPLTEGRLKCHITEQIRKAPRRQRTLSYGFSDPGVVLPERRNTTIIPITSGILVQRKQDIEQELLSLRLKGKLTEEELAHQRSLVKELQQILSE